MGHEVRIVSLTPLGPMGLEARSSGIPTESLEMRRGFPDPRGLARLVRIVRAWRPDVLHSHMVHDQPRLFFMHFWANDNAEKLARGLRAALDQTNHGTIGGQASGPATPPSQATVHQSRPG